ncbi:MAG: AAA family ATPase [Deltaproteobacteria bacterium]|nr:AAA family ATPase [Deltaproteobacteria bacterium]
MLAFETWIEGGRETALLVSRFRSDPEGISLQLSGHEHGVAQYGPFGPVQFRGLLPDDPRWSALARWREAVDRLAVGLVHLDAIRTPVARSYSLRHGGGLNDHRGERAPFSLAADADLCADVGAWVEQELGGWRVRCEVAGEHFALVARRGAVTVNLAETGQGLQQVLPVVVQQLARQREPRTDPFLDLIEQPELHLHTGGQAPLADLVIGTARLGRGAVVVETHSENFLLRLQRRVAEGKLPADDVAVYWVDDRPDGSSRLVRVRLNGEGETERWPAGVFAEAYEEVKALRRAQRPRGI